MPKSCAAFLSYSHRYAGWVKTLHANLEACLRQAGETRKVFLDQVDLGGGRSWVGQLQAGLDEADQLVLVVTPEALASPRVEDEWGNFFAMVPDWKGRLQVAMLVDTPLPPFLTAIRYVDFRDPAEAKYRQALRELLSGLLGQSDRRALPELAPEITIPEPLAEPLPAAIRRQLVGWLASTLERKLYRPGVAYALGLQMSDLAGHPSLACAASAAIVRATGDDDPVAAALRIVKALGDIFDEDPELLPVGEQLEDLVRRQATDGGLLGVWLRSVERDHAALVPYFEQAAGPALLGRVYVELELRADRLHALLPKGDPFALAGAHALEEFLELDPGEHPWVTRRWVVLGDPGAGKTTLLRYLAWSLACAPQPRWVPLFESWPRLMRDREWLLDRVARQLARAGHPARGLSAVLDREAQEGRLLLLLDGLDEIPRQDRDEAESLLRDISARWPRSPIVVTSRPIGYRGLAPDFLELDLLPLDRERQREFLARRLGRRAGEPAPEEGDRALRLLHSEADLRELASNPLYLTQMALLIERGSSPDRHRSRLYDQVFALLLAGGHRPEGKPMDCQDATRRVLRHLAHEMIRDNRDAEPREALEARLYQPEVDALREPLEKVPRWRRSLGPFLDDLAEHTGILGPHDGRDADWRFWHRTFREALAAEALVEKLKSEGEPALLQHARQITGEEARWAEPYSLLFDQLDNPDGLIQALLKVNRTLVLAFTTDDASFQTAMQEARRLIVDGHYLEARKRFAKLIQSHPAHADLIPTEFGFLFDFTASEETDCERWEKRRGQLEWRRRVWAALADHGDEFSAHDRPEPNVENAEQVAVQQELLARQAPVLKLSPEAKGEKLERATLGLLRLLFHFEETDEQRILDELSQQSRGTQLGFDIKATYCQAYSNRHVRCLVECKSQEKNISPDHIGGKLHVAENFHPDIDHWILSAPRAGLSTTLKTLLDRWEAQRRFPFSVQAWTRDTEVWKLFGLSPALYEEWCDHPPGEEHPAEWSQEKRNNVLSHWRQKLEPPLRLPEGWNEYLRNSQLLRSFSDEPQESLERVAGSYIELRGLDESGAPLPESLSQTVRRWLDSSRRVLLLLGGFGAGKTIFTYLFSHELLEETRMAPKEGWIPLRLSLRDFSRPGISDGRDFLRRRLEEFGANRASWGRLTEEHKILVLLDGADEMSTHLDRESVNVVIQKLIDCCNVEFRDRKILLTCRTPFFDELAERDYLLDRLDAPLIVRLRSFDRSEVVKRLTAQATTQEQKKRLYLLRGMHDPVGLATKPLFFEMISQTVWNASTENLNEVGLYEEYVHKSLERKADDLDPDDFGLTKEQVISNMIEILELIALEIHSSRREYACLRRLGESRGRREFASWLWERFSTTEQVEDDARSRVGIRSLLRRVEVGDDEAAREAWPVDFCHRSLREYFVARKVESLIRESASQAARILAQNDLSHEIIHFVALLIRRKQTGGPYHSTLRWLAEQSRSAEGDTDLTLEEKTRLGRNAVTLLFRAEGELREEEWRHMSLDGANLAGADLSGKDFSGTSLRNAILANARFTDANFCNADLTAVRIEETAEVRGLSVAPSLEGFVASYTDGKVRWWDLVSLYGTQPQTTFEASTKSGERLEIAALPGSDLCVFRNNEVIFADRGQSVHTQVAAFNAKAQIMRVVFKEDGICWVEEVSSNEYLVYLDLFQRSRSTRLVTRLDGSWLCDSVGDRAILHAETSGKLSIQPFAESDDLQVEIGGVGAPSALSVRGPIDDDKTVFLIACGEQDGFVGVWELRLPRDSGEQPLLRTILREKLHGDTVTALAFIGDHALLSGGNDKLILRIELGEAPAVSARFLLRVECEGMRIEGLKGEKERRALERIICSE